MPELIPWTFLLPPLIVVVVAAIVFALSRTSKGRANALLAEAGRHTYRGEHAEAEKKLRDAAALRPDDPAINGTLASLLVTLSRLDDAEELVKKALARDPSDHRLRLVHAQCAIGGERYKDALAILDEIPDGGESTADAKILAADALEALGDSAAAIDALDEAIARLTIHEARPLKVRRKRLQASLQELAPPGADDDEPPAERAGHETNDEDEADDV